MEIRRNNFGFTQDNYDSVTVPKTFVANVFSWMFLALGITAFIAYYFADSGLIDNLIYKNPETGRIGTSGLGWVVALAPLALVFIMSGAINKLSGMAMILLFIGFSTLMGMSLSTIFIVYTASSIFQTFLVASLMFGIMAIAGYTTKTDLTKLGSLLFMALIGIVIASIINMFMRSGTMEYVISFIGVLVFTGLTAYDVQKIKNIGSQIDANTDYAKKMSILGALTLYLDFINLFLFLLRFMGRRD